MHTHTGKCGGAKDRKGMGINSEKSDTRNLEPEKVRVPEAEWRVWEGV